MRVTPDTVRATQHAIAGIYMQLDELPEVIELPYNEGWQQWRMAQMVVVFPLDRKTTGLALVAPWSSSR